MEWSTQQAGARKELGLTQSLRGAGETSPWELLGPVAPAASIEDGAVRYNIFCTDSPDRVPLDERETQWRRRVALAQAQALGEAFARASSSIPGFASRSTTRTISATTESWSPWRGFRRRKSASFPSNSPSRVQRSRGNPNPANTTTVWTPFLDKSSQPPTSSTSRNTNTNNNSYGLSGSPSRMMEVNVVPSVVLHFHGFRSSLLSNLGNALYRILLDMAKRCLLFTGSCLTLIMVALLLKQLLMLVLHCVAFLAITMTTTTALNHAAALWDNTRSVYVFRDSIFGDTSVAVPFLPSPSLKPMLMPMLTQMAVPTLPLLNVPSSIANVPDARESDAIHNKLVEAEVLAQISSYYPRPSGLLLATQRRIAAYKREPMPCENRVRGERRRRADVVLHKSKIRVGKAYLDPVVQAMNGGFTDTKTKRVDMYMVRVDCSRPDDKHMNPVVMWDFTASFDDFRNLEKTMRKEMKAKRLRNVHVPHLSSGALLFFHPQLNDDVLAKRRERLQKFVELLCADPVLADCDAMRVFCQACF